MLLERSQAEGVATSGPASHGRRRSQTLERRYTPVIVFALAALTLSACGGSGSTNPPASRPNTTGLPSTPTSKPSVALPPTTPSTEVPTTVPPTTPSTEVPTTVPPTTPSTEVPTTVPPTTPSTEVPTTVPPTSTPGAESAPTTIAGAAHSGSPTSSTPWGWIVVVILLVAVLVVALVLWHLSRSRRAALMAWRQSAGPPLQQAQLARELLIGDKADIEPERREDEWALIETAAQGLEGLVNSAPDAKSQQVAAKSAAALRGLMFADQADRLLRSREKYPTADELAQVDDAKRLRVQEFDFALEELIGQVQPELGTKSPPARLR